MPDELKDKKPLVSNDEAFHLTLDKIAEIVNLISSRKTPTPGTFSGWDEYAISFYLKMHTCFGFVYHHLEPTSENENGKKQEMSLEDQHLEDTSEDDDDDDENGKKREMPKMNWRMGFRKRSLEGPIEFGRYSSETKPKRIPYHLYLLVKEAVDIMKRTNDPADLTRLTIVEKKIKFFCRYLYSHLPTGWNYDRDKASSLIAKYDTTRKLRYRMAGYTPIVIEEDGAENDEESHMSRCEMILVMCAIYSRKTPSFWTMSPWLIAFYCKLCSCFGIKDYHHLENASEDDVCLMKVGQLPTPFDSSELYDDSDMLLSD